jgi:type II secretory pathway component PulF
MIIYRVRLADEDGNESIVDAESIEELTRALKDRGHENIVLQQAPVKAQQFQYEIINENER